MNQMQTTDVAKAKAEATFKRKEQQARDGAKAMAEYEAAQIATQKKTARLRALREAKEAKEAAEATAASVPAPDAKAKGGKKLKSVSA